MFKLNKKKFKNANSEDILKVIREIKKDCSADKLPRTAFKVNLSRNKIIKLKNEYVLNLYSLVIMMISSI